MRPFPIRPPFRPLPAAAMLGLAGLVLTAPVLGVSAEDSPLAQDLAGAWRFQLDPADEGRAARWADRSLTNHITLPTTTDLAGYGAPEPDPDPGFLSRTHKFIGAAWYQRDILIPEAWRDHDVELFLERVLWESRVWVDGRACGTADSLGTPHRHDLGRLAPGTHRLTVRVDNRMIHPIGDRGHCYTEYTQTIWNGIVGRLELRARPPVRLTGVRVFPDADRGRLEVETSLANHESTAAAATLRYAIRERGATAWTLCHEAVVEAPPGPLVVRPTVPLPFVPRRWDEFDSALYEFEVRLVAGPHRDRLRGPVGFRTLRGEGNRLLVNGRPTFLRGNLDCAQYPLTGHPPMDVASWRRVFKICQAHGFNHVRFHSWCPPEAAFIAADELGLYLLPEVLWIDHWMGGPNPRADMDTPGYPLGVGKNDRTIDAYVRAEMRRMLDTYGNHPSFCFFAIGNELGSSDFEVMGRWIQAEKERDPRRLYAASTARAITPADDFSDTHHIPGVGSVVNRLGVPHTDWDYQSSYARAPVPIIAHEMGQMPVYPDWREIAKYRGPVRARNFDRFREQARANGIATQSAALQRASGAMNRLLYKQEMEAQLRSPGCAGVSWLSLQDFPGQGEALVGWRDVFYDTKGLVTPEQFRRYSSPTVPLARFAKFVWTTGETFTAKLEVAHWGAEPLPGTRIEWRLRTAEDTVLAGGQLGPLDLPLGSVTSFGEIQVALNAIAIPSSLRLEAHLPGREAVNDWVLWVFPPPTTAPAAETPLITPDPTAAWPALEAGRRVLLLAHQLGDPNQTRFAAWMPLFWSARFFPGQNRETLGALVQSSHPALAGFPTADHLDWQWREICDGARGFVLNDQPAHYRPIVQPVSDYHFNHKLGTIFEFRTETGGRLLVCGYDLVNRLEDRPAAAQLRASLVAYAAGDAFEPSATLSRAGFKRLFE